MSLAHHYNDERNTKGRVVGWVITLLIHAAFLLLLLSIWIKRVPNPDMINIDLEILADMYEEPEYVKPTPQLQEYMPAPSSGGPLSPVIPAEPAQESTIDEVGDVEIPTPPQPTVNRRSLYRSDEQGAEEASAAGESDARTLYRGQTEGQQPNSNSDTPSWSLDGRSVQGRLGQPVNTSNKQGRVVVEITVDQQGRVVQAKARATGSTVQDAELWRAAEKAAMETLFNVDTRAAVMQRGTITYIFRLR